MSKTDKFDIAHEAFMKLHAERRTGERRGRLLRGNRHAETMFLRNVWWPLYNNFDQLHPEYEIIDWRGRPYYGDFAFLGGQLRLLIEIKGFGTHVHEMDRQGYSKELNRELYLQTLGYRVASFAYDDVERRPELCRNLLDSLLQRYRASEQPVSWDQLAENEIIRLAMKTSRPFSPKQAAIHMQMNYRTVLRIVRSLCGKGWLRPVITGEGKRIRYYELIPGKRGEQW